MSRWSGEAVDVAWRHFDLVVGLGRVLSVGESPQAGMRSLRRGSLWSNQNLESNWNLWRFAAQGFALAVNCQAIETGNKMYAQMSEFCVQ